MSAHSIDVGGAYIIGCMEPNLAADSAPVGGRPRVFYGWWIVLLAVFLNVYQGGILFYGFTLLITPMREEMGWSFTAISSVYLIMGVLNGFVAPTLGYFFDRIGPRPLMAGGIFLMGAGLVLLGQVQSIWTFYATFILANLGVSGIWISTGSAVPNWFIRRRGRAIGIQSLGYAFSGVMTLPYLFLIDSLSWRTAVVIMGVVTWFLLVPATMIIRRRPEDYGLWPDGVEGPVVDATGDAVQEVNLGVREALRTRAFWLLALGFSMGFLAIAAIQVHEAPYMESVGFSRRDAALLIAAIPLSTIPGRIGFGLLADYWDKRKVAFLALCLQAISIMMLASFSVDRVWLIGFFLVFWGLGFGGTVVVRPALQGDLFGRKSFGALQGVLSTTGELGFAFAPVAAGVAFDLFGTYRPVFLTFALMTLMAAPMILMIRTPRSRTLATIDAAEGPMSVAE